MTHRTSDSPTCLNMEESKQFTVKQNRAGDDSGYSSTSTQSKYSVKSCHSQSASSGDSCFDERRSTTLESTEKGKLSTSKSISNEQPSQTALRYVSGLETTINQESNIQNLKAEQIILTTFEPQIGQLFNTDDLKNLPSTSKIELYEPKNLNEDIQRDHEKNSSTFLHLANLCQSYHDHKNKATETSSSNYEFSIKDTVLKEVNDQEILLKEMIESNEVHEDLFGVIVSMNDGLIINTSNSIHKNMGYPKNMCEGRSFVDFIHPKDRISFISYVTSVLTDPYTVSKQDGTSSVTFLKSKNNDGFYCNMQKYRSFNAGYSVTQRKNHYQVCKLTTTFKDLSYAAASSSHLANQIKISRPQLILIVNAQLVHSAYTYPEETPESPVNFITKHNALFEWCYVDHLIISHFGYLPQNIIGRSIFSYFNHEDVTSIKEVHENMIRDKSISYIGKPYRFKCQNGDFALVQTEWSNFVNPWSGRAEFFIGRHKVIQGPINPDVTTPVDDAIPREKITDDEKKTNNIYEDIKKILNKNIYEATEASHRVNNTTNLNDNIKKQISRTIQNLGSYMNCLVKNINGSVQVPLEVEVQPETCDSFSDHGSVMLGEISPHHNYENKSSSETPPSYTQLNYNNNIKRFFDSNLKTNSIEDLTDQCCAKENSRDVDTPFDMDMENAQSDTLLQSVTPSSCIFINNFSESYSEQNSSKSSQQPLTQKVLLRHNKIMEDDLVKHHKNNTKKNKSSEKQKQHVSDETKNIVDTTHGVKRSNSSVYENSSCKFTKRKHRVSSNSNVVTQTQDNEDIAVTHTVARGTQIWPPCQITRDSQTTADLSRLTPELPSQAHCYNSPLGNNVMPMKLNEFENPYTLIGSCEQNQEPMSNQLQSLTVPLYATIPMMNHSPQNSQILQPYLYYHNQLLLQQPHQNIQFKHTVNPQSEPLVPPVPNVFHQKTKGSQASQVNQEEVITSSDSDQKREFGSFKSSSGWMYEDSSFYSSSMHDKTESSDREEWPSDFNKIKFADQLINRQPFWMENIESTPDLIFRYQIEPENLNKILQRDMNVLKTFTQPSLVNEQLRQLCAEIKVNGSSKTYFEDGTSRTTPSSGEEECLNLLELRV